jgi:ubiquinone/menaquinone biosynthesis C-methylase UbiE
MKEKALCLQYNSFSDEFSQRIDTEDNISRNAFYSKLPQLHNKKVLDMGCGDGADMVYYKNVGSICYGIDSSEKLINQAKQKGLGNCVYEGDMRTTPFTDNYFDVVVSKYVFGTIPDPNKVFEEVFRVLKSGGHFIFLSTSPIRHFQEQNIKKKDYFSKGIVDLECYGGAFVIKENIQRYQDYFSNYFLKNFVIEEFTEHYDPQSACFPFRTIHPDFFIIKATKR